MDSVELRVVPCRVCGYEFSAKPYQIRDRTCLSCFRIKQRKYRRLRKEQGNPVVTGKASKEYRRRKAREAMKNPVHHFKMLVRRKTMRAVETGKLIRLPCEVCGAVEPVEAHHDDYNKPFDVRWLCRSHHAEHHAKERLI